VCFVSGIVCGVVRCRLFFVSGIVCLGVRVQSVCFVSCIVFVGVRYRMCVL